MIFTIGYEGYSIQEFVSRLKSMNVSVLYDVRWLPLSRKEGFSKSSLKKYLENAGIEYQHLKELGTPKELREKLYSTGDYETFFSEYASIAAKHQELIQKIVDSNHTKNVCIMCFEHDPSKCHRSVVSRIIQRTYGQETADI